MSELAKFEGLVPGDGNPFWSQSYYWNAYDPKTGSGVLIRCSFLENQGTCNSWLIAFRDGRPVFTRTNQTLPYTSQRPADGLDIAGMRIECPEPLKKTRITFDEGNDFSMDITWEERNPMADVMAVSKGETGTFAQEIAHVHLEGPCNVKGSFTQRGETTDINATGYRDIGAGPRNWDAMKHYRLMWPVFDDGTAFVGIHGMNVEGQSAYMRMYYDGNEWLRVTDIDDRMDYDHDNFLVREADWRFTDEKGRDFAFNARPVFGWLFNLDTFVLREQMMEFRVDGQVAGYGMCEQGYRLPWTGIDR